MQICAQKPSGQGWGSQLLLTTGAGAASFAIIWPRTPSMENALFITHQLSVFCDALLAAAGRLPVSTGASLQERAVCTDGPPRLALFTNKEPSSRGPQLRKWWISVGDL